MAVIPLFILGYGVFEKSVPYKKIFSLSGPEAAFSNRFITKTARSTGPIFISRNLPETKNEFNELLRLTKKYSLTTKFKGEPQLFIRSALKNATYVEIEGEKIPLVPESVPIYLSYCTREQIAHGQCPPHSYDIVGSVADIRCWYEAKTRRLRSVFEFAIVFVSITLGLLLRFKFRDHDV